MLVRGGGNFHENIREFHPIKPGHLVQDCPGLGSPALELQPGERLWDPPAQRERDEAVLLASLLSHLLPRMTGRTRRAAGRASWDQWLIREERRGAVMEARL